MNQPYLDVLKNLEWTEGAHIPLPASSYRYRVTIVCSPLGRQEAQFSNGKFKYFAYTEQLDGKGNWIEKGVSTVPVLPDGRVIMIVEQRPVIARHPETPMSAFINGRNFDLRAWGAYSSLEFPGGAVDPNEGLRAGFLRELTEETEVAEQEGWFVGRKHPAFLLVADIASRQYFGVVYLSNLTYSHEVMEDGGLLTVLALTPGEVQVNINEGVIHGAHSLITWQLYLEVEHLRHTCSFSDIERQRKDLTAEKIRIAKPKPH